MKNLLPQPRASRITGLSPATAHCAGGLEAAIPSRNLDMGGSAPLQYASLATRQVPEIDVFCGASGSGAREIGLENQTDFLEKRGSGQERLRTLDVQLPEVEAKRKFSGMERIKVNIKNVISAAISARLVGALLVGMACLSVAAWVSAEEGTKADPANILRQVQQAGNYVDRINAMVQQGLNEQEEARNSQNLSRVNCVGDALSAMKGMLRIAQGMYTSMQERASRKDADGVEAEYVKISITFNKCEELEGQLKGCGGPSVDGAIDGRPVIEKVVEDIPDMNPTQGLTDLSPKAEVLPSASPIIKLDPKP